jgi:hypothetical protein
VLDDYVAVLMAG